MKAGLVSQDNSYFAWITEVAEAKQKKRSDQEHVVPERHTLV